MEGSPRFFIPLLFYQGLLYQVASVCPDEGIPATASDNTTWPPGFSIGDGNVTLDFPLILDVETPRLKGLHIASGGRLVFSPSATIAKLVTDYVIITDGGSLEIGSEDCPFLGKAEILLTGIRGSYDSVDGEKYVSVHRGGKLEIHGKPKKSWTKLLKTVMRGMGERAIYLEDDVGSWEEGDQLVLASTDFDMNQAEVVSVISCVGKSCIVDGLVRFDHFGEVDSGVDMRGEVGLLSRNILIHGEMEGTCYGEQLCSHFEFDTFGGHIVARDGFASFKVENAEFTNLGQQGIVARYPLHWHMAGNVSSDTSYVRSNSIHHTLQRCVTCHGSFGCVIEDNIAFESLGHCYFMEDGVENGTIMTGNLGINTRKGFVIPSDKDPATFWITHPNSYITGNAAAGSEGKGFWFLQPSLPTGLSGKLQQTGGKYFFGKDELFRTKIGTISGNTAHSSPFGFFFDNLLQPDQGASSTNGKFSPSEDPTDPMSPGLSTSVSDITCYKAEKTCIWMHLPRGQYSNIRTADSAEGLFVHEDSNIHSSLFVGESERNFGVPAGSGKNFWYRSLPRGGARVGFRNYVNPTLIKNSTFVSFKDSSAHVSRALGLKFHEISYRSIFSGASNLSFISTPLAGRYLDRGQSTRAFIYKDYTGSISTFPDTYLVNNFPHLKSKRCAEFPEWGSVSACPHRYVSIPIYSIKGAKVSLTRTDNPESSYEPSEGENQIFLSVDQTFIISFTEQFPVKIDMKGRQFANLFIAGVNFGYNFTFGSCVPIGSELSVMFHTKVFTIEEVRDDTSGAVFFHDTVVGVVFFSIRGTYHMKFGQTNPCGADNSGCLSKKIVFNSINGDLTADCTQREGIFPKYQDSPLNTDGALVRP